MTEFKPAPIGPQLKKIMSMPGEVVRGVHKAVKELSTPLPKSVTERLDFTLSKDLVTYDDIDLMDIDSRQAWARTAINFAIAIGFDNSVMRLLGRPMLQKFGIDTLPATDPVRLTGAWTKTGMIVPILEAAVVACSDTAASAVGLDGLPNLPIEKFSFLRQLAASDAQRIVRGVRGSMVYHLGDPKTLKQVIEAARELGIDINPPVQSASSPTSSAPRA